MPTDTTAGFWRRYGALWARLPKELAYLIAIFVIALAVFSLLWGLFSAGLGTVVVLLIGVFIVAASLYVARWNGTLDLILLEWAGRPRVERPIWRRDAGFFGWLRSLFGNAHYWLYLLYALVVQYVVSLVSFTVTITWLGLALGGTTWLAWSWSLPFPGRSGIHLGGLERLIEQQFGIDSRPIAAAILLVVGLVFLFTLPYITRGFTALHGVIARGMLGAFRREALEEELAGAEASRAAAVSAEDSALRRLERDIHDGPQQRLVRMQMDLASADRRLDAAPDEARALIAEAAAQAKEALEELRALSRGFAPPILLDRGLVAALESAAVRSAVPARVVNELPEGFAIPPDLERNAYFIASEALVNAVKHADATAIVVRVSASTAGTGPASLRIAVWDDGRGGASTAADHGLAGLRERARGLGGELSIESPDGGPTIVSASLPLPIG